MPKKSADGYVRHETPKNVLSVHAHGIQSCRSHHVRLLYACIYKNIRFCSILISGMHIHSSS